VVCGDELAYRMRKKLNPLEQSGQIIELHISEPSLPSRQCPKWNEVNYFNNYRPWKTATTIFYLQYFQLFPRGSVVMH
jgi:hypothetical protein